MKFWKIIKLSLSYRWSVLFCALSALGVGVLWGTNLSAVYPFMEITFKGNTMRDWVDDSIVQAEERLGELRATNQPEYRIAAEETALGWYRYLKPVIYRWTPATPFATITALLALLMLMTLMKLLFQMLNAVFVARIANRTTWSLRNDLFARCLELDLVHMSQNGSAQYTSRLTNDLGSVNQGLSNIYGKMVREPLKMFVCLGLAIWINWRLFLVTAILLPPIAFLIQALAKKIKKVGKRIMKETAVLFEKIQESFYGIKIIKCFSLEEHFEKQFDAQGRSIYRESIKSAFYDALAKGVVEFSGILIVSIALLVGAWLILSGGTELFGIPMSSRPLSIEWLVMFYVALLGAADPARKLSDIFTSIQNAAAAAERVYEVFELPLVVQDSPAPIGYAKVATRAMDLEFSGVDFDYAPDRPVLRDVQLTIPFGSTVAFVGANGCGKSTLLNLIPRLLDPVRGEIRLGGVPLPLWRLRDLRDKIGIVTQDAILFDDTVENNIRLGRPGATHEEIVDAARHAFAHDFITRTLPQGYDTPLGPLGNLLSGGQKQRLALARVILRNPQILLLDEATSQIDLQSELAIRDALSDFHKNRTVVIVTHRIPLLTLADTIFVMDAGRVVESGTHDELMQRSDFYRRLHLSAPEAVEPPPFVPTEPS
ncbi:MAG: ABC transporter ATP-binding protein [Planctomycetia bacterium]|nr:ABC transporter ATP-binding protein [Planctomycetia bacterium]